MNKFNDFVLFQSPTKVHCEEPIIDPVTQSWFTSRDSKDNLSKKGKSLFKIKNLQQLFFTAVTFSHSVLTELNIASNIKLN